MFCFVVLDALVDPVDLPHFVIYGNLRAQLDDGLLVLCGDLLHHLAFEREFLPTLSKFVVNIVVFAHQRMHQFA